jgi:hypothetical protein
MTFPSLLCKVTNVESSSSAGIPGWWERFVVPPQAPAASRPTSAMPTGTLDVRALLHPTEFSRLVIALSASAVVFGGAAIAVIKSSGSPRRLARSQAGGGRALVDLHRRTASFNLPAECAYSAGMSFFYDSGVCRGGHVA